MELTTRLAKNANVFPLPVSAEAAWTQKGECWHAEITLDDIEAQHIIVPSFASPDAAPFQFSLLHSETTPLHPVPAPEKFQSMRQQAVSTHVDCWHSETQVQRPIVRLSVETERAPTQYLLAISVRPLVMDSIELPTDEIVVAPPTRHSQMTAAPAIKQRICSPTALAMALSEYAVGWEDAVTACYDPATRSYGAWPLAIRWAAMQGILGTTEVSTGWQKAITSLGHGKPVVCSIRFDKGKLVDAPLERTGGHLVCLYGVRDGKALVMDPAAPDNDTVARSYDLREFTDAWLQQRGAAYFFGSRA